MQLILTPLPGIPNIKPGDDLIPIALAGLTRLQIDWQDGDVLAVTQKVVSIAEDRVVELGSVSPSIEADRLAERSDKDPRLVELILRESKSVLRVRPGLIIVEHRLGFICANAGIDRSNVQQEAGKQSVVLLPENPDESAARIQAGIQRASGRRIGVLIIDSHGRAWRMGTVGSAIGIANLPGLLDMRGLPDLFGYHLESTLVAVADELAGAASLVMGQAAEGYPIVHIRGFPHELRSSSMQELLRPAEADLFR